MARPLGRFPTDYPWDLWMDGRPWELEMGEDFDIDVRTMQNKCYDEARARGGTARTHRRGALLVVQFVPKEAP